MRGSLFYLSNLHFSIASFPFFRCPHRTTGQKPGCDLPCSLPVPFPARQQQQYVLRRCQRVHVQIWAYRAVRGDAFQDERAQGILFVRSQFHVPAWKRGMVTRFGCPRGREDLRDFLRSGSWLLRSIRRVEHATQRFDNQGSAV